MPRELKLDGSTEEIKKELENLSKAERHAVLEEAKAQLSRTNFIFYNKYVNGWAFEPRHTLWAEIIKNNRKACLVAPPGTGKTRTLVSIVEWYVGQTPDMAWLYVSNTAEQAKKQVGTIGSVLISDRYKKVFPTIKQTDRWSTNNIYIDRSGMLREFRPEATVSAFGIFPGTYQGLHVDGIVIDDPTDQQDVFSPGVMQTQKDLLKGVLYDRLAENGFLYIILTRWGDDDLIQTITEDLRIPIFTFPIVRDDEYPWRSKYLIEGITSEYLNELEYNKGPDLFKLSYLCSSSGAIRGKRVFGDKLNKITHLHKFKKNELLTSKWIRCVAGGDWGTTSAHKAAIVVVTKRDDGLVVVRGAWSSPSGSSAEFIDKLVEFKSIFGLKDAWIDRSQSSLRDQIQWQVGINAWKGEASVEYRISTLLTLLDISMFKIDADGPGVGELWNQLTSYARDENGRIIEKADDYVDALLYALAAIYEPKKYGLGPRVEIVPSDDDQPMVDAYHDSFDPSKWNAAGRTKNRKMKDYNELSI